jgi:hypothetical protein
MTITPEQLAELQGKADRVAELESKLAAFSEREAAIAEREAKLQRQVIERDIDALIGQGKVLPAEKGQLADFIEGLDDAQAVVSFGESEQKISRREYFVKSLEARKPLVEFGEVSSEKGEAAALTDQQIAAQAIAFQEQKRAQGIVVSTSEAVDAIRSGSAG